MALTKVTGGIISPTTNVQVGIITATTFKGNLTGNVTGNTTGTAGGLTGTPAITVGNITAVDGTFSGNVSIAKTLTYEDVTNIDSVGLITAIAGIKVTGGELKVGTAVTVGTAGVVTATTFVGNLTGNPTGSGANLTSLPAGQLTGTVADARISTLTASKLSGALPAISGANLTSLPAANLTGTVADARISTLTASKLSGALPAIDGSNLTGISGGVAGINTVGLSTFKDVLVSGISTFSDTINFNSTSSKRLYLYKDGSDEFSIYNSSGYAYITHKKSSYLLQLQTNHIVKIGSAQSPWRTSATFQPSGGVELYNANDQRFATTAYGVTIHGNTGSTLEGGRIDIDNAVTANSSNKEWSRICNDAAAGQAQLQFYTTPSGGTITERLRILTDGKVGIGSTAPGGQLDVRGGGIHFGDSNMHTGSVAKFEYGGNSGVLDIKAHSTGGNTTIKFHTALSGTTGEKVSIDSSGNITAVNTASGGQSVTLKVGASHASGVNDGIIKIVNGGTGNGVLQWDYEGNAARAQIYVYRSDQELRFTTAGTERLRLGGQNFLKGDWFMTSGGYLSYPDGVQSIYGDGDDMRVHHTGGVNHVRASNGNLVLGTQTNHMVILGAYYNAGGGGDTVEVWGGSNMLPATNDAIDLGETNHKWDDIYATNGSIQTSDRNNKDNFSNSDLGLSFINKLTPMSYKFKGKFRTHYGLIAQDVETVLDDISKPTSGFAGFIKTDAPVQLYTERDEAHNRIPSGKSIGDVKVAAHTDYGLRYNEFIAPLIKAVQELSAEVETLKTKVTTLESA